MRAALKAGDVRIIERSSNHPEWIGMPFRVKYLYEDTPGFPQAWVESVIPGGPSGRIAVALFLATTRAKRA
jgi:hypothetical protein